jgi:putrescine aminotransferase
MKSGVNMVSSQQHSTEEWQALDRDHYLHPFTDLTSLYAGASRIITRAEGVYLWDSDDNRLLDGFAGLWCVNMGYGRSELVAAAAEQMQQLPYYNSFFNTATPPALELAELLAELSPPQFNYSFFTGSGSEANDTIVRMVRRFWELEGQPGRINIIARHNAYHGSTMAGASLGGMEYMHKQGGLPIPNIEHIMQPYWYELGGDLSPDDFGLRAAAELEQKILELGADTVAAFIGEPIQGAGGVIIPPATYWPAVQAICNKYDVLLVADEVICGFGRTGKWFGSDTFGIEPDLMAVAKGMSSGYLPIGAVLVGDRVAHSLIKKGGDFAHGYTYSGHPVCAAVAVANLKLMRQEGIVDRVANDTGPYFQKRIAELAEHPLVGEARGIGMIGALELVADKDRRRFFSPRGDMGSLCRDLALANGLILRATKDTMLFSPPLVMDKPQIDDLISLTRLSLDQAAATLGGS